MSRLPADPFMNWLGAQYEATQQGHVRGTLEIQLNHLNAAGVLNGGVSFALADTAMGLAMSTTLKEGETCATLHADAQYRAAVRSGTLTVKAEVIQRGKRSAAVQSEVMGEGGKLILLANATFYIGPMG